MKIIRSFRKTLAITIGEDGEVIVKAPYFLSEKKILIFVKSKENWIEKQRAKITKKQEILNKFDFKNFVYLNGCRMSWDIVKNSDKRMTKASFYTKKFYEMIENRAERLKKQLKINASFKLCNSKCIWGSCNANNTIKINWKIILLKPELQDYVILHELCHVKEMNHSKKFWELVEENFPSCKVVRKLMGVVEV